MLRDLRTMWLPAGTTSPELERLYWGELARAHVAMVALGFVAAACLANAALAFTDRLMVYGDLAAMAFVLLSTVSAASFLSWLYRSVSNAWRLQIQPLEHSPSWSVFCWFVPLVNLVHPLRVVKSLYDASDPDQLPELDEIAVVENPTYREPAHRRLVRRENWNKLIPLGAWWSCFLAGGFIARAAFFHRADQPFLEERLLGWAVSGHLALLVAAVSAILVIRGIVLRRGELYRRLALIVDQED